MAGLHNNPMLSRCVFKQLTDSFLLGPGYRAAVVPCLAAQCQACRTCNRPSAKPIRHASSSSSTRWKSRQGSDFFAREARVQGLKSRAAFKLLEVLCCSSEHCSRADSKQLNEKHKLFKPGQTVVDLVCILEIENITKTLLNQHRALRRVHGLRFALSYSPGLARL